jgi:hypothetical protein
MNVTVQQMGKLLQGQYAVKHISFSRLLTRLKTKYAAEPTQTNLEHCVEEINAFLEKYKILMSADFAIIAKI